VAGLLELAAHPVRRAAHDRREAQEDGREGLVDLVVEVLRDALALGLLGMQDGQPRVATLQLHALEHAVEPRGELEDLARGAARGVGPHAGARHVDAVHDLDQVLHRPQSPAQQDRVEQDGRGHRETDEQHAAGADGVREAVAGHHRGHGGGHPDEDGVDGEDVAEEGALAHSLRPGYRHLRSSNDGLETPSASLH
jgi:hypothetical protein